MTPGNQTSDSINCRPLLRLQSYIKDNISCVSVYPVPCLFCMLNHWYCWNSRLKSNTFKIENQWFLFNKLIFIVRFENARSFGVRYKHELDKSIFCTSASKIGGCTSYHFYSLAVSVHRRQRLHPHPFPRAWWILYQFVHQRVPLIVITPLQGSSKTRGHSVSLPV